MNSFDHDDLMRAIESEHPQPARIVVWEQIPAVSALPEGRVEWIVEGLIAAGSVVLFAGESGSGKTFLGLLLARGVAGGGAFLGRKCLQRDVLYLDRENPAALLRQRVTLLRIDALENFKLWGAWLPDPPPLIGDERLLMLVRERQPLIIVDSFIRFHQMDENSASGMAPVMNALRELANAGAAVVVIHHKPKGDGSQYRGSSDIRAGVDIAYAVSHDADSGLTSFKCFKNRLAPEFALTLRPELETSGDFGVVDASGEFVAKDIALLRDTIAAKPGMVQRELISLTGLGRERAVRLLREHEGKLWHIERGRGRMMQYYPDGREPGDDSMGLPFQDPESSIN